MFICDDCLTKKFRNEPRLFKSRGPCELCEQYRLCSDIQSGQLLRKPQCADTSVQRKTNEPTV